MMIFGEKNVNLISRLSLFFSQFLLNHGTYSILAILRVELMCVFIDLKTLNSDR
jgi:hypothetical protein